MPPRTRRSLRVAASPSPSTPATTNPPSIFSSRTSPADSSLSEVEDESPVKTRRRAVVKRKAQSDLDEGENASNPSRPATKRRALSNRVYVEVPAGWTNGGKPSKETGITASKGKGKAPAVPESGSELDSELEYDENQSLADSDSSGSEFVASEAEMEDHENFDASSDEEPLGAVARRSPKKYLTESAMDSEDEDDVMLDAAIRLSREEAQGGDDAGPSSSRDASSRVNPQALLRAAAAERRLSKRKETTFGVDDSAMDLDDLSSLSSDESDVPLAKGKGKGKGKGKAKTQTKTKTVPDDGKSLTLAQRRKLRREASNPTKAEEKALRKKLGRKLTHAEKTAILLRANHEELRDVWGDLEAKIGIVEPVKAEQPSGIKLTLLPFQLESLYWMRKQEEGIWHGGMLAVRLIR
ncbi:DNA repair protein rad16 [Marasmius tenuissimus]|nr:DNA repair protein rad16 [Marasmius tenuissimus]